MLQTGHGAAAKGCQQGAEEEADPHSSKEAPTCASRLNYRTWVLETAIISESNRGLPCTLTPILCQLSLRLVHLVQDAR